MLFPGKKLRLFLTVLLSVFLLASCADKSARDGEAAPYYSFTDSVGNKVVLGQKPQNVAVLFSSFADVWQTAGGEIEITVGESIERGFAAEDTKLVDEGAGKSINTELLLSYEPDFILASADIEAQVKAAKQLSDAGIPTALFHVECFDDYLAMLKICTDITENADAYQTFGVDVKSEIDALMDERKDIPLSEQPQILFIRAGSSYSSTKAKTAEDHFACQMLKELGTVNIAEKAPLLLDGLSLEEILLADPDYIFISTMGKEQAAKEYMNSVLEDETWQTLSTVRNGNYVYLPKDLFQFKPNARWAEAYRYLAALLDGIAETDAK